MAGLNPFRLRYTEQQRDHVGFLRTFGVDMLEVLPKADVLWNRLLVLRSAPGAGKTSILRLMTAESLSAVTDYENPDDEIRGLLNALEATGAIDDGRINILGILVNMSRDYRSLMDLGPEQGAGSEKVFFKLLDLRILARAIESALAIGRLRYPADAGLIRFVPKAGAVGDVARSTFRQFLSEEVGDVEGVTADVLLSAIRVEESRVVELLDSLLPVDWDAESGHARLYSLQLLASSDIEIDGSVTHLQPVVMFDDVHDLAWRQREALYAELVERQTIGRWIAERQSAVDDHELLTGRTPNREYVEIYLEDELATGGRRLERLLQEVANRRAVASLSAAGERNQFTSLLRTSDQISPKRKLDARAAARTSVELLCESTPRFRRWLELTDVYAKNSDALDSAIRYRELEIIVEREIAKGATLDFEVEETEPKTKSDTRAAARLFLSIENKLPYYAGADVLADLSSSNVEQYLGTSGDLFDLMLSALSLRKRSGAFLEADEQHRQIKKTSKELWEAIPRRVPDGPEVQVLLHAIADKSRDDTFRPTAPYSPGVTGTAIDFDDRSRLFVRSADGAPAGYERLRRAMKSAVAHNLLEMSRVPNKTKGQRFAVLYLNRLLLPHFNLPLQRGGFREQSMSRLARKLDVVMSAGFDRHLPDPDTPLSNLEGWPR